MINCVKGVDLLRREISLKVICEKSNFQSVIFALTFVTMNGHIYIYYSKPLLKDVQTEGKG